MPTFLNRLWQAQLARARTSRGMAATIMAAALVVLVVSSAASNDASADGGSGSAAGTLVGLLIVFPAIWWAAWGFAGLLLRTWRSLVAGQPPQVQVGRRWQAGGADRKQLREDAHARIFTDRGGILLRRRVWFVASGTPPFELSADSFARSRQAQQTEPQALCAFGERTYWWYRDTVYWTNDPSYTAADVKALLFARERQHQRKLEHAHALLAAGDAAAKRRREPIPRDVKLAVWQRDEGRCVECDGDFDLQYDHVIPFSMGGANTVDNLQLLCARCNQRKGGKL
jgi:HNH endonuclease